LAVIVILLPETRQDNDKDKVFHPHQQHLRDRLVGHRNCDAPTGFRKTWKSEIPRLSTMSRS
jgi:hypothetical protein